MRCCYQLIIRKTCGTAIQDLPEPTEFGHESYGETNGRLALRLLLMSQSSAPPELMNDFVNVPMDFVMRHAHVSAMNNLVQQHVCVKQQCHVINRVKMKYV